MVAPVLRRARRREGGQLAVAALEYAEMGWPVCLGAHPRPDAPPLTDASRGRALRGGRPQRARSTGRACTCDRVGCPAPAAHPMSPAWQMLATCDTVKVRQRWARHPDGNIILPTGRVFDVLDVPDQAGARALGLMQQAGVEPGPVAAGNGRTLFFVATRGAPEDENEWWSCQLDCAPEEDVGEVAGLRWHCRNSFVLAPPSRDVTGESARWIRWPAAAGAGPLPDAVRLLELLADACDEATP